MSDEILIDLQEQLLVDASGDTLATTIITETLVLQETPADVLTVTDDSELVVSDETLEILDATAPNTAVEIVTQGPQGPAGVDGASTMTFVANGAIGGHRAVVADGDGKISYADATNATHVNAVVGITLGAAVDGAPVTVQATGEIVEPSWNWTPLLPVFLSVNGLLSQSAPGSGFHLVLGVPTAPTKLAVGVKTPFVLGA